MIDINYDKPLEGFKSHLETNTTSVQCNKCDCAEIIAYTYILECSDGTLYTGYTTNLENRLAVHNSGKGAKYTRARLPVKLVYYETFNNKSDAMKREYRIKCLSREEKLNLIHNFKEVLK